MQTQYTLDFRNLGLPIVESSVSRKLIGANGNFIVLRGEFVNDVFFPRVIETGRVEIFSGCDENRKKGSSVLTLPVVN